MKPTDRQGMDDIGQSLREFRGKFGGGRACELGAGGTTLTPPFATAGVVATAGEAVEIVQGPDDRACAGKNREEFREVQVVVRPVHVHQVGLQERG
jgi:hypothetical protein